MVSFAHIGTGIINSNSMWDVEGNEVDTQTAGEILAIALLTFLVASVFIVSGWSAVLLLSGNTENGGPIGLLFNLIRTSALV